MLAMSSDGAIMLILDIANNFFQHIFQRQNPNDHIVFGADQGHRSPRLAKQPEGVGDGLLGIQEGRRVQGIFEDDQPAQAEQIEQVLRPY